MAETSVAKRMEIASRVAADVQRQDPDSQIWLEGPLAEGLAHAHSDIDLRVITANTAPDGVAAKVIDGVRLDIGVSSQTEIQATALLLDQYDAQLGDLTSFRLVRRQLPALTLLRTARRWTAAGWRAVLDDDAAHVYRLWALADRIEVLLSLTEDLTGLLADGLVDGAEIVVQQMDRALVGAEAVAAGRPLLGDKWLPCLTPSGHPRRRDELGEAAKAESWFPTVRRRLVVALTSVYEAQESADTAAQDLPPGRWWLPQRYADGWYARYRDSLAPMSASQALQWLDEPIGDRDG